MFHKHSKLILVFIYFLNVGDIQLLQSPLYYIYIDVDLRIKLGIYKSCLSRVLEKNVVVYYRNLFSLKIASQVWAFRRRRHCGSPKTCGCCRRKIPPFRWELHSPEPDESPFQLVVVLVSLVVRDYLVTQTCKKRQPSMRLAMKLR